MAFRFVDGCDMYATAADIPIRWELSQAGSISVATTGGRYSGGCITFADTAGGFIQKQFIDTADETAGNVVCVGFSFKTDNVATPPGSSQPIMYLYNSQSGSNAGNWSTITGRAAMGLEIENDGRLKAGEWNAVGSPEIYGGTTNVCDGSWHWIECRFSADASSGYIQVYVDGSIEINVSGINTTSGGGSFALSHISFTCQNLAGSPWRIDDVMIWDDTTGSTGDKDADTDFPLGDSRIELLYPTGAGTNTDWTPSAGSNYQCVDEAQPNETDYVDTETAGHTDTYAFGNMTVSPTTIHTVCVQIHAKDSRAQGAQVRGVAYNVASEGLGPTQSFTSSYQTKTSSIPRDPNTTAAWTESGVNSSEFGVEKP